jgi:hypothetical protein
MGCTCSKSRNSFDESLNNIIEDTRIYHIYPEEYLNIIKKAIKSKKDLNDKFNFQTEIIEVAMKSTNLYIEITYLKNTLTNLPEEKAKCFLTFSLLFLCKFSSLENLKKNFAELFPLIKNQIKGLEEIPNKNNFFLVQKIIELYATLVSKHLLDVYAFSLTEVKKEQKELINEYKHIFGSETIRIFVENLFEPYQPNSFEADKFFDYNLNLLDPNILRERLKETYDLNETEIKSNNKIVFANRTSITRKTINNDIGDLVYSGNPNFKSNSSNKAIDNKNNHFDKSDLFDNSKNNLTINSFYTNKNEKSTEESLDSRVDKYLREKGLISSSFGALARNNSNYKEDSKPTAAFEINNHNNINKFENSKDKNITDNNDYLLNDKDKVKNAPLVANNLEFDINKISFKDKKEDLVNSKNFKIGSNNYVSNKNNKDTDAENKKKFSIEENIFQMNSPSLDNLSEGFAESEFNILLKSRRSNSNHHLINILNDNNNNNKEKQIELSASPKLKEKDNIMLINNEKEKKKLDDIFSFFGNEASHDPKNIKENFNKNCTQQVKNNHTATVNNNLLDFDFTQNTNSNSIIAGINIKDAYKKEENSDYQNLFDPFKSNSLENQGKNAKETKQVYNPFEDQENKDQREELNLKNVQSANNSKAKNNSNNENNKNSNNINMLENIQNEDYNKLTEEDQTFNLEDFREEALRYHNFKRLLHSAEELSPSEELENRAQEWAEYLAEKETLENRNLIVEEEEVGENLACIFYSITGEKLTEEWYSHIEKYNFDNPRKKNSTASFTQMVWKSSNFVGFGAKKSQSGYFFAVAFYYQKGNVEGLYADNVLPIDENIINQLNQMDENHNGEELE